MKANELREMTIEELTTKLGDLKTEFFNLRFQMATSQLDNTARVTTVKRDIARIYTVIRERELGLSVVPGAEA